MQSKQKSTKITFPRMSGLSKNNDKLGNQFNSQKYGNKQKTKKKKNKMKNEKFTQFRNLTRPTHNRQKKNKNFFFIVFASF